MAIRILEQNVSREINENNSRDETKNKNQFIYQSCITSVVADTAVF